MLQRAVKRHKTGGSNQFNRTVPCTFDAYLKKDADGHLRQLKDATHVRPDVANPIEEYLCGKGESKIVCAAGFYLAHCGVRRFLGALKRRGGFEEFAELIEQEGVNAITFEVDGAKKGMPAAILSMLRWLDWTNVVRDMSAGQAEYLQGGQPTYTQESHIPRRSGILFSCTGICVHDVLKPSSLTDATVSDPMALMALKCYMVLPCWSSRMALVQIMTFTRSVPLLAKLVETAPRLQHQEELDAWLVEHCAAHIKPRSSDRETSWAMCVVGHPHYVGRDFASMLDICRGMQSDTSFPVLAAAVRSNYTQCAEFLTSHFCVNLCWLATAGGPHSTHSETEESFMAMARTAYMSLDRADVTFNRELQDVVSKANTSAFSQAFLAEVSAVEFPSFIRNPLGNPESSRVDAAPTEVMEFYQEVCHELFPLSWPLKLKVTGFKAPLVFTLPRQLRHPLVVLVNACMCEKVRKAMAARGSS